MDSKNSRKSVNTLDSAKHILQKIKDNPELLKKFAELISISEDSIPDYIFVKKLTLFESIVKYLKENRDLNYKQIADIVNRDQRNIWQIYNSAKRKFPSKFIEKESKYMIPTSVLASKYSILESIVKYLKEDLNLSYTQIADIIHRSNKTIWTVYNRQKNK